MAANLPETFHVEMAISPLEFNTMMTEDHVKKYIKEKMAYELAMKILESNRATFTYINNHHTTDMITVRGRITL
jgi:hypothetical protein